MAFSRLKKIRKESGFTQKEIAEKLNVAESTVGMWEQERREPDIETYKKLAEIFDCSIDYILGTTNHRKESILVKEKIPEILREYDFKLINIIGNDLNDEEIEELKKFADFLKSKRKNKG